MEFEIMSEETMEILKNRIKYIDAHPEKLVFVGESKQLNSPMFTNKEWTKILTRKAIYVGIKND